MTTRPPRSGADGFPPPPPPFGASVPPPPSPPSSSSSSSSSSTASAASAWATDAPPPPGYQAYSPAGPGARQLAGFGSRLGAYLLDYLLYGLLGAALAMPGILLLVNALECTNNSAQVRVCGPGEPEPAMVALSVVMILAAIAILIVIYLRALGRTGQTWGCKIVGIKVVCRMTGQPIGMARAFGRQAFASIISGQIVYLGYLWMLWDAENQTWHDKIADSIVVEA